MSPGSGLWGGRVPLGMGSKTSTRDYKKENIYIYIFHAQKLGIEVVFMLKIGFQLSSYATTSNI